MSTNMYTVNYAIETDNQYFGNAMELEANTYEEAFLAVQNIISSIGNDYRRLGLECTTEILSVLPQSYTIAKQAFHLKTLENTKADLATIESIFCIEGELERLGLDSGQQAVIEACDRVIGDCMQFKESYPYYIDRIKEGQSFQK